jgi:hypothetical protein
MKDEQRGDKMSVTCYIRYHGNVVKLIRLYQLILFKQ